MVVFSIITLLCLGGGAALFVYYDKATAPDLSSPALVTRKYLAAYLLDRDDVKAAQFRCADDGGLADVRALRSDIDSRQTTYKIKITVSIDSVTETSRSDTTATTTADIVLSTVIDGKSQSAVEHWVFSLKDGGGWLVCSGHEQI